MTVAPSLCRREYKHMQLLAHHIARSPCRETFQGEKSRRKGRQEGRTTRCMYSLSSGFPLWGVHPPWLTLSHCVTGFHDSECRPRQCLTYSRYGCGYGFGHGFDFWHTALECIAEAIRLILYSSYICLPDLSLQPF